MGGSIRAGTGFHVTKALIFKQRKRELLLESIDEQLLGRYYVVADALLSLYLYFIDFDPPKLLHLCEMRTDGFRLNF